MTRPTGEPTVEELRSFYFAVHAHQKNARAFSVHFSWQNARAARMRQFSGTFGPSGKRARTGEEASCAFTMTSDNGLDKVPEKGEGSNGSDMVVMEQVDQAAASPALMLTLAAAPPPRSPPSPLLTSPDPLNPLNPGAASSEVAAPTSDELSLQQDALKEEVEESGLWPMSSGHVGTEAEEGSGSKGIDAEAEGVAAPAIVHDCMLAT